MPPAGDTPSTACRFSLMDEIINIIMRLLTETGYVIAEEGVVYAANTDPDNVLAPSQAACRLPAGTMRCAHPATRARDSVLFSHAQVARKKVR